MAFVYIQQTTTSTTRDNESRAIQKSHLDRERASAVVNPKTGKAERVFVNLEAVYPDPDDPAREVCFEELRAVRRGWAGRDWRKELAGPLQMISGNVQPKSSQGVSCKAEIEVLGVEVQQCLVLGGKGGENSSSQIPVHVADATQQIEGKETTKMARPRRVKVREIKQEAQTGKSAVLFLSILVCFFASLLLVV